MKRLSLALLVPLLLCTPSCERALNIVLKKDGAAKAGSSSDGTVEVVSSARHDSFINQRGPLVVVDYYADWCGPCRKLAPVLARVAGEFEEVAVVGKVDVDVEKEIAMRNNIRGIPEVRFFRDGQLVDRFSGAVSENELRKRFTANSSGAQRVPASGTPAAEQEPEQAAEGEAAETPTIAPMNKDWLPPGLERR